MASQHLPLRHQWITPALKLALTGDTVLTTREDTDLQRRLGLEVHVIPKQVHGASLQLVLPVQHHVAVVAELARRVPALEFAEPPLGFWEKVFARAAAAGRRHQP